MAESRIVALIGSPAYDDAINYRAAELELAGHVVLRRNASLARLAEYGMSTSNATAARVRDILDTTTRAKIQLANEVVVVAPRKLGELDIDPITRLQIDYARDLGKPVHVIG